MLYYTIIFITILIRLVYNRNTILLYQYITLIYSYSLINSLQLQLNEFLFNLFTYYILLNTYYLSFILNTLYCFLFCFLSFPNCFSIFFRYYTQILLLHQLPYLFITSVSCPSISCDVQCGPSPHSTFLNNRWRYALPAAIVI